jgi:diacylglycerol kinase (ATP)
MISNEKLLPSNLPSFSWKARVKSFKYAWEGIVSFFKTEHNAQIHLAISVLVLLLSVTLKLTKLEAIAVVFSIAFVWVAEMINTVIEKSMDFIAPGKHPQVKLIKDIAAGAVLVAAIAAAITGCLIFIPKLFTL